MENKLHKCDVDLCSYQYGTAVDYCHEDENGFLMAGNGEYGTIVRYCPFCGYKAKKDPHLYKPEKRPDSIQKGDWCINLRTTIEK